ncbi:MAG: hemerythrin domain-containing protein [Deltaproteobacteria bacterium]|nr:hemerythrin domain-containing protein [Deltaproteobacteria bacterium]
MNDLNLSNLDSTQALEKINAGFEGLKGNDILSVSCDNDFYETIKSFQEQNTGKFFWAALKNGPDYWRGELLKVDAASGLTRSILSFMDLDHKRCDRLYANGETAIFDGKTEEGIELITYFITGMLRHFDIEEKVLFPAFESETGMVQGPTMVMRMEHQQMISLLQQMETAVESGDKETITGIGETMVVLMQQHNIKEEGMLYPMIDQHLGPQTPELIARAMAIDYQK